VSKQNNPICSHNGDIWVIQHRSLFNEKHKFARAVTPKDIADLFGWFHTVYYFETFFAFGETNTVNKSSAGESLFTDD